MWMSRFYLFNYLRLFARVSRKLAHIPRSYSQLLFLPIIYFMQASSRLTFFLGVICHCLPDPAPQYPSLPQSPHPIGYSMSFYHLCGFHLRSTNPQIKLPYVVRNILNVKTLTLFTFNSRQLHRNVFVLSTYTPPLVTVRSVFYQTLYNFGMFLLHVFHGQMETSTFTMPYK